MFETLLYVAQEQVISTFLSTISLIVYSNYSSSRYFEKISSYKYEECPESKCSGALKAGGIFFSTC